MVPTSVKNAIISQMTDDEKISSVVYADGNIYQKGSINVGGNIVEIETACFLAFVDKQPGSNWMHPCRYLFVEPVTLSVRSLDSTHPPVFGNLPESWVVVWKPTGVENWKLLTKQ